MPYSETGLPSQTCWLVFSWPDQSESVTGKLSVIGRRVQLHRSLSGRCTLCLWLVFISSYSLDHCQVCRLSSASMQSRLCIKLVPTARMLQSLIVRTTMKWGYFFEGVLVPPTDVARTLTSRRVSFPRPRPFTFMPKTFSDQCWSHMWMTYYILLTIEYWIYCRKDGRK